MIGLQVVIWAAVFIALIYIIIKRIDEKGKEDFEQRNN